MCTLKSKSLFKSFQSMYLLCSLKSKLYAVSHGLGRARQPLNLEIRPRVARLAARWDVRGNRQGRSIALGWTANVVGGVKNHLKAIREHSSYRPVVLPSDFCIRTAGKRYLPRLVGDIISPAALSSFDILHSHVDPWFVQQCYDTQQRYGKPWVHTYHTLYFQDDWGGVLKPWQKEANRRLLSLAPQADICLSVSQWLHTYLAEEYGVETLYLPNGIDYRKCQSANPERFRKLYGKDDFALFVGTGAEIKNPVAFIELARQFKKKSFVMVGRRLSRNIFLDRYGITIPRNVKILGPLKHEEVLDAIAGCRVFVMTSRSEGLPTVLMEAMALGKPVVGSDRFGIPEVIGSKKCGFIYRFGDAADLSAKFQTAWHDGVRCNEEAKKRIRNNYDWSKVIKLLDSIYGELLT